MAKSKRLRRDECVLRIGVKECKTVLDSFIISRVISGSIVTAIFRYTHDGFFFNFEREIAYPVYLPYRFSIFFISHSHTTIQNCITAFVNSDKSIT
jgi:hypothetical protein